MYQKTKIHQNILRHTVYWDDFALPGDFRQAVVYQKKVLIKQEVGTLHLPFWTFYINIDGQSL